MNEKGPQPPTDTGRAKAPRRELWQEATVMALYVSIVTLAALVALPSDYAASDGGEGHSGPALLSIVWGTAIGLALAHWVAFEVAAIGFHSGKVRRSDLALASAQIAGAAIVAAAATIAILFADDSSAVQAAAFAPALIIGVAGYGAARAGERSVTASVVIGVLVLLAGLAVAIIKTILGGH
mgnify:CR=1 FL=1